MCGEEAILSRFHLIVVWMDRQMDGRTDRQTECYINIVL